MWFLWSNISMSITLLYTFCSILTSITGCFINIIRFTSKYAFLGDFCTFHLSYKWYCFVLGINPSRRYYGIISTLSIVNNTKYIYGLDKLCNQTGPASLCLNITTSTSIVNVATTIVISRATITMNYSYLWLVSSFIICFYSTW
jgi:hypothetical protein